MEPRLSSIPGAPPNHAVAASAGAAAPAIVALSEDGPLLQALTRAVIERSPVVTSPSVDRFIDQLVANDVPVALIDAATAPAPLAAFVLMLRQKFPQLLLVLAGSPSLQNELAPQIADGTVFRFLHKPVAVERLKLFINAALESHRIAARRASAAATPPATGGAATARRAVPATRHRRLWPLLVGLTALLAGALAAGWYLMYGPAHGLSLP